MLFAGVRAIEVIRYLTASNSAHGGTVEKLGADARYVPCAGQQHYSGRQPGQFVEAASVQRQVDDLVVCHYVAQVSVFRIEQRQCGYDFDDRTRFAQHQVGVEKQVFPDFHFDVVTHNRFESRGGDANFIDPWIQGWHHIHAGSIGGHFLQRTGSLIGDRDGCSGDDGPVRIVHRAAQSAGLNLSGKPGGEGEAKNEKRYAAWHLRYLQSDVPSQISDKLTIGSCEVVA